MERSKKLLKTFQNHFRFIFHKICCQELKNCHLNEEGIIFLHILFSTAQIKSLIIQHLSHFCLKQQRQEYFLNNSATISVKISEKAFVLTIYMDVSFYLKMEV